MSHFYAEIRGNRGEVTRQGSKSSGIRGHIRGWNVGARIVCRYDEELQKDVVSIYATGGTNENGPGILLIKYDEDGNILVGEETIIKKETKIDI